MSLVRMVEKSLMEGLPVLLHFPRTSLNEWVCSEGLLPMKEDDILKQSQAFLRIRWLSASSCSGCGSLTMETAIFVKCHLKKWLLSLTRGALQAWILYYKLVVPSANPSHIMSDYFPPLYYTYCVTIKTYYITIMSLFLYTVFGLLFHIMLNSRKQLLFHLCQYYYINFFGMDYFNYIN